MPTWFRVLGGGYLIATVNSFFPFVTSTNERLNDAISGLVQIAPFMMFAYALIVWSARKRLAWALLLLPVLPIALLIATISALNLMFPFGVKERVQSVPLGTTTLNAYRTDGGATERYGMIVRQELETLPGVLIVRQLASEYPASSVLIERPSVGSIRLTFPPYGNDRLKPVVVDRWLLIR